MIPRISVDGAVVRRLLPAVLWLTTLVPHATGQEQAVTITGDVQPDGGYRWVVANYHNQPIVFIEFPHYHADVFHAPPGWKKESTYLVNVGVPDKPGTCTAWVDSPGEGITRYATAEFGMRIARVGARRGTGEVLVRFADGSSITVAGVILPTAPAAIERYVGMVGFALILAIVLLLEVRRRRRARRSKAATSTDAAGEP